MSEMVERVALAISGGDDPASILSIQRTRARAAIEAMREPTKEMIYDGNSGIDDCIDFWNYDSGAGYSVEPHAARDAWQRMIDAALKENTNE